tara:strand:- start:664 stop:936 length:273 start_codon:yes stop_codon:yes gene_type:complete
MLYLKRIIKVKQPISQIFRKFSALEVEDDYYEFPKEIASLSPPICPICNNFIDDKKCKSMSVSKMCPLEAYNRNKNIIDSLIEQLKKKNR